VGNQNVTMAACGKSVGGIIILHILLNRRLYNMTNTLLLGGLWKGGSLLP